MPEVSIIIPTYKHGEYVLHTLASVFAQSFTDYEVIVVNDGSPDDTADVLRPLVQDGRIRYIEQANAGQAAARNRGLREAQGTYIAFLDDDDLWPPDKLLWQAQVLQDDPGVVMAYGYWQDFTSEPLPEILPHPFYRPSGNVLAEFTCRNHLISPGQALMRAEVLRRLGGFDPELWGADDWDIYIRLAVCGEFVYQNRLALYYRRHADNASRNVWRMYCNARRVWRKHCGLLPPPAKVGAWWQCRRYINEVYFEDCARLAQGLMAAGKNREALEIWLAILTLRPGALRRRSVLTSLARCLLSPV